MLQIERFVFSPFSENTYILFNAAKQAAIIDPGCYNEEERDELVRFIEQRKLTPIILLNTHCHIDHIFGNAFVAEKYGLELTANLLEIDNIERAVQYGAMFGVAVKPSPPIRKEIHHGDEIFIGEEKLQVLFTPGHSAGSVSFYASASNLVISGDALFEGSIGRTDLPGGDYDTLIDSIKRELFSLPDETFVYSGHGERTTIGRERRNNPFFQ